MKEKKVKWSYSENETVDLTVVGIAGLQFCIELFLCYISFEEEKLIHPRLCAAAVACMLVLPAIIAVANCLTRHLYDTGILRHCQSILEKMLANLGFALPVILYCSWRHSGIMFGAMLAGILVTAVALCFAYHINLGWQRQKAPAGKTAEQEG